METVVLQLELAAGIDPPTTAWGGAGRGAGGGARRGGAARAAKRAQRGAAQVEARLRARCVAVAKCYGACSRYFSFLVSILTTSSLWSLGADIAADASDAGGIDLVAQLRDELRAVCAAERGAKRAGSEWWRALPREANAPRHLVVALHNVDGVSVLLCTVTFYANHAHSLTRSP